MRKNTNDEFGTEIPINDIFPQTASYMREILSSSGNNTYSHSYNAEGSDIFETFKIDESNFDYFSKRTIKSKHSNIDSYTTLLGVDNDPLNASGSYITFSFDKNNNKFNYIFFRHCEGNKIKYAKKYTDDDLNKILESKPEHPLISIMQKSFDMFEKTSNKNSAQEKETQEPMPQY